MENLVVMDVLVRKVQSQLHTKAQWTHLDMSQILSGVCLGFQVIKETLLVVLVYLETRDLLETVDPQVMVWLC